jgi:hypothetical protein
LLRFEPSSKTGQIWLLLAIFGGVGSINTQLYSCCHMDVMPNHKVSSVAGVALSERRNSRPSDHNPCIGAPSWCDESQYSAAVVCRQCCVVILCPTGTRYRQFQSLGSPSTVNGRLVAVHSVVVVVATMATRVMDSFRHQYSDSLSKSNKQTCVSLVLVAVACKTSRRCCAKKRWP